MFYCSKIISGVTLESSSVNIQVVCMPNLRDLNYPKTYGLDSNSLGLNP